MNRARSLRTYLTVMWLIGGLLSLLWVWQTSRPELILAWTTPTFVLMILSLLVIVSNSDQLSLRVRREIPVSRFKRALAFLFFNGAAGGLIWAAVIIVSTLLVTAGVLLAKNSWFPKSTPVSASDHGLLVSWTAVLAYVFAYLLTALLIQRKFLPKRSPKLAGLLAVLLASRLGHRCRA